MTGKVKGEKARTRHIARFYTMASPKGDYSAHPCDPPCGSVFDRSNLFLGSSILLRSDSYIHIVVTICRAVGFKSNHLKTTNKKAHKKRACSYGVPKGIRTPVAAVKGQCPGPLDDGDYNSSLVLASLLWHLFWHLV